MVRPFDKHTRGAHSLVHAPRHLNVTSIHPGRVSVKPSGLAKGFRNKHILRRYTLTRSRGGASNDAFGREADDAFGDLASCGFIDHLTIAIIVGLLYPVTGHVQGTSEQKPNAGGAGTNAVGVT